MKNARDLVSKWRLLVLSMLLGGGVSAQAPRPVGVTPFSGEISLRYTPTFESRCTIRKFEKKPGEFFGTRSNQSASIGVFEEAPGKPKLAYTLDLGANYFRMVLGLNDGWTGISQDEPVFQTDIALTAKDDADLGKMKVFLSSTFKKFVGLLFGTPLRFGAEVPTGDICELFPDGRTTSSGGRYSVLGLAQIRGRASIVFGGEQLQTCNFQGRQLDIKSKGWQAIDRESGLISSQSLAYEASATGTGTGTGVFSSTEDHECVISGAPAFATNNRASVGERLVALRALYEKGLITLEQFQTKRDEILKAL